jgi:hypothetical protein
LYETVCLIPDAIQKAKTKKSSKKLKLLEVASRDLTINEKTLIKEKDHATMSESAVVKKKSKKKRNSSKKKVKRAKSTEVVSGQVKPFDFSQQNMTVLNPEQNLKADQLKSCLRDEKNTKSAKKTARINTAYNTTLADLRPAKKESKPQKVAGKVKQIIDAFEHKVVKVLHGYKSIASDSIRNNV